MLTALIKTKNKVSNILDIVRVDQQGGEQFLLSSHHAASSMASFPSVAERTLDQYSKDGASSKKSEEGTMLDCFGCGGPHAWSKRIRGTYKILCPNANQPGVADRAKLNIRDFQARKKCRLKEFRKCKNVNTINWEDIPLQRREVILQQQQSLMLVVTADTTSVASSLTSPNCGSMACNCSNIVLHQDAVVLTTEPSKPPILITIHSLMAHVTLQTGCCDETKDFPGLCCIFNSGAALNRANYRFMEAVITQYPHIVKQIYIPNDYAAIILSSIVSSKVDGPITTELSMGFKLHLPYHTKDGSTTSLLVVAGPDVAVNVILGLPFIKATGMIANSVDNVCKAKQLCCPLFPINFKCATKFIPAFTDTGACTFINANNRKVIHIHGLLNAFYATRKEGQDVHIIQSSSTAIVLLNQKRAANTMEDDSPIKTIQFGISNWWTPPSKSASVINDYFRGVLENLGYL
jgi:hypothetical protein